MILGDNIFYGADMAEQLQAIVKDFKGAVGFAVEVEDARRYGVYEFDENMNVISIEEKPENPKSNYCVTGLYVYDNRVIEVAKNLKPSVRGELEITDVNKWFLEKGELEVAMVKGEWLDAGTFDSLLEAQILAKEKLQDKLII
jgi:glucose-1-phosphate thymidylyltransferase